MTQLIECIPNFSEARRPEVIDQIIAAITSVEGARLLDRSSDLDHNRTVLTFAGKSEALLRQALAKAGVDVPVKVDLEMNKYIEGRGEKKLKFNPAMEIKGPFGVQERF